jgi:hypothetical protein
MRVFARSTVAVFVIAALLLTSLSAAAQDASWLDGDLASWNAPGMAIPNAPDVDGNTDPRCSERERSATTAEDEAVSAAGWSLFLASQQGWGVTVISGLAGYDGMCRPLGYQSFVFVDGEFAGTVAPEPMYARTDGAGSDVSLWFRNDLTAEFVRYTADDPLCCPSSTTMIIYTIEETANGPVVNPVSSQA